MSAEVCSQYLVRVCESLKELVLSRPLFDNSRASAELCKTFKEFYESLFTVGKQNRTFLQNERLFVHACDYQS